MTVQTGPCDPWTTAAEVLDGWDAPANATPNQIERAVWAASDVLFQLGGQRWPGTGCSRWLRPVDCSCLCRIPFPEGGIVAMRAHGGGLCGGAALLDTGVYPLTSVHEVRLGGVVLAGGSYRVHDDRYIARTDGGGWPCVNRFEQAEATPGIEVHVQFGAAPPALGRLAATALARELLLAWGGSDACRLDRRVRSITREQVSMDFAIPGLADTLRNGYTGIPEVDLFIVTHNPHRLRRAARFVGI